MRIQLLNGEYTEVRMIPRSGGDEMCLKNIIKAIAYGHTILIIDKDTGEKTDITCRMGISGVTGLEEWKDYLS